VFRVLGDNRELYKSKVMLAGQTPEKVDVEPEGIKTLVLMVGEDGNGISYDHADWADAKIVYTGQRPKPCPWPRNQR